ncbi:hypothetical protein A3715_10330 [Oleiphilus sp. HI0009]|nr:hypothetical protein A3715_10330 [Oleiphilus sp. HI0009]
MRLTEKQLLDLKENRQTKRQGNTDLRSFFPVDAWTPRDTSHFKALNYLFNHPEEFSAQAEHFEQVYIFHYFEMHYPAVYQGLFAVPNAGKRGMAERGRLSSQGLRKGIPDIFLDIAIEPYHGCRIELKRTGAKSFNVSNEQNDWIRYYNANGYYAKACFGYRDAIDTICSYLNLNK